MDMGKQMKDEKCYGTKEDEILSNTPEEALIKYAESFDNEENIIFPITIYTFKRAEISLTANYILDYVLESLDDEYGSPYMNDYTESTPAMKDAAENLVNIIKKEYMPWQCEIDESEKIYTFNKSDLDKYFKRNK